MTPQTTNLDELPPVWRELRYLLINAKKCRDSNDTKGREVYVSKIEQWRDAHPKEASAFVKQLTREIAASQPP